MEVEEASCMDLIELIDNIVVDDVLEVFSVEDFDSSFQWKHILFVHDYSEHCLTVKFVVSVFLLFVVRKKKKKVFEAEVRSLEWVMEIEIQ